MNKVYSRINWENEPSTKTPLNEHNLNKIDFAVDEIDNRVIEMDSTTAKNTDLQTLSTRVDNLILNAGDSSAECADARVTEDGTTYDTLKKRLDAEHSSVIEDISQLSNENAELKGDLYNDFTVIPGIFSGNRRLESDGTYSPTEGYRVFDTPPKVKGGDKICFMILDKSLSMKQAELRYMFSTTEYPLNDTYVENVSMNNAENFYFITVPKDRGITQIFISFSAYVANSIRVFIIDSASESILNAYGYTRQVFNVSSDIMIDNLPESLDNLVVNTMYRLQPIIRTSWLPDSYPYDGGTRYIIKYHNIYCGNDFYNIIIYNYEMKPIFRKQVEFGTDFGWKSISNVIENEKIHVGSGERFNKITDALEYAYSKGNVHIVVKKGNYDITNEINVETSGSGPIIGNNTILSFEQGAIMTCNYTGTNDNVKKVFSPINAGSGDFRIENANIRASNVRYCVHDELGSSPTPYKHEYINCDMWLDNSDNNAWDSPQCIGGGLGEKGYIIIDGGYYDSLPSDNIGYYGAISYHNGATSECKSNIVIKNTVFENSTARFGYYGTSEQKTKVLVTNCSMKTAPTLRAETNDGSSPNVNMVITAFNNVIG